MGKKKNNANEKKKEKGTLAGSRTRDLEKFKISPNTNLFGPAVCFYFLRKKHRIAHGTRTRDTRHTTCRAPKLG